MASDTVRHLCRRVNSSMIEFSMPVSSILIDGMAGDSSLCVPDLLSMHVDTLRTWVNRFGCPTAKGA